MTQVDPGPRTGAASRRERGPPPPLLERLVTPALAASFLLFCVGLASTLEVPSQDQVAALVLITLGSLATVAVVRWLAEAQDLRFLGRLVMAGILLRVGLALIFHAHLPYNFFAPDQGTYHNVGWRLVLWEQGRTQLPHQVQGAWEVGYYYWNAFLFRIFGNAPLGPKVVNAFLGAWTGLLAYRIGGELVGKGGARRAGVLAIFFPSLVLWSTQNLRDTAVVFVLTFIFLMVLRLRIRVTGGRAVAMLASLALLSTLRDYMAVMMVFALAGSFFISPRRRLVANVFIGIALLSVAVLAYQQLGLGSEVIETTTFQWLDTQREALATGGTAFRPDVDLSSPSESLGYLPVGIVFFLFSPFPWQVGSVLSMMTLPEMLAWYVLLVFVVSGALYLVRHRFNRAQPMLLFVLLTSSIYGLVEGNAGTAYRHRAQIVVFFLIFAAVGLEVWRQRRARKRSGSGAGASS